MAATTGDGFPHVIADLDTALRAVLDAASPTGVEWAPVEQATGRRLSAPVCPPFDVWPFARSAMDGYAVRSADLVHASARTPVLLQVIGTAYAGRSVDASVAPGTAVRIMTGAVLPEGADAVIPQEAARSGASLDAGVVGFDRPVAPGANVVPAAEEARCGEPVLVPGHLVGPSTLGLLATLGVREVEVFRRPSARVLAIGDELVDAAPSTLPLGGRLVDANSPAFAAALAGLGATVTRGGIVPDDLAALRRAIEGALDPVAGADLLVLSGGVSAGERDLTLRALELCGAEILFTRLRLKPGKAAAFARVGRRLIFALPGSPGAAMATFWLLVAPAVRAMSGAPTAERDHPRVRARLMQPAAATPGRPHYLWGRLAFCAREPAVWLAGPWSTGVLRSQALANCLVELPAEVGQMPAGSAVSVVWFGPGAPAFAWSPVPVVSVVGPHDSGKTTVLERLIPELARRGIRAGVLKHDVHGFEMDREGKDTWRLARSGAPAVGIVGPWRSAVLRQASPEGTPSGLPAAWESLVGALGEGTQLVFTEGYRSARTPKIEVVPEGASPLTPPPDLLAVVSRADPPPRPEWLSPADPKALADRVERWLARWYAARAGEAGLAARATTD